MRCGTRSWPGSSGRIEPRSSVWRRRSTASCWRRSRSSRVRPMSPRDAPYLPLGATAFCAARLGGGVRSVRAIGRANGMQQPRCLDTRECAIDPALGALSEGCHVTRPHTRARCRRSHRKWNRRPPRNSKIGAVISPPAPSTSANASSRSSALTRTSGIVVVAASPAARPPSNPSVLEPGVGRSVIGDARAEPRGVKALGRREVARGQLDVVGALGHAAADRSRGCLRLAELFGQAGGIERGPRLICARRGVVPVELNERMD